MIRYAYLWQAEHQRGQDEGVKDRLCAVVLVTTDEYGDRLLTNPERFSMKYIDVLSMSGTPTIAPLSATISLGGHDIDGNSIHFRSERPANEFINIVQIMSPTEVRLPNQS